MKTNASATSCASVLMWRAGKGAADPISTQMHGLPGRSHHFSHDFPEGWEHLPSANHISWGEMAPLMEKTGTQVSRVCPHLLTQARQPVLLIECW